MTTNKVAVGPSRPRPAAHSSHPTYALVERFTPRYDPCPAYGVLAPAQSSILLLEWVGMAKQVALAAQVRHSGGKGAARRMRRAGRIPAVTYGVGMQSTPISVDALELYHVLHTGAGTNAVISLSIEGRSQLVLAREIQRHPVRREILHVDFVTVQQDVKVDVDVPIMLEGEAPGAEAGGVVSQELYAARVSVLPLEVPEHVVCDISGLEIGDLRRLGDLQLPAGVELLDDPERTVVTVVAPTAQPTPELEEAAASEEAEAGTSGG
jgi:large subunit ribosomal protein L25